jgi:large subunit ribosomal protein L31
MKPEIHPEWHSEAKVIYNGEVVMTVGATQPEIIVDIWSGTHPYYTGESRLIDTEGQVDRFLRRLRRREEIQSAVEEAEEESDPLTWTIDEMSLGDRAENALTEAGLATVADVYEKFQEGEDALLAIPGVGQRALIDIKRFLRAEGIIE